MPDQPDKPKPTIDERLEAITMNLEIASAMQPANEKAIRALADETKVALAELSKHSVAMMDAIKRLANGTEANTDTLHDHQERIDRLENPE